MNTAGYFELAPPLLVAVVGALAGWAKWRQEHPSRAELRAARAHARDFAATNRAHLTESVEEWAARTGQQPTRTPRPAPAVLNLPAPRKEES